MIILHLFHTFNTNYDSESGTTFLLVLRVSMNLYM